MSNTIHILTGDRSDLRHATALNNPDLACGLNSHVIKTQEYIDTEPSGPIVVIGDRLEALQAAVAATKNNEIIIHVHAGDVARGINDDPIRDAISCLAHIHCAATKQAHRRLRKLGEHNVAWTGSPAVDSIEQIKRTGVPPVFIDRAHNYALVIYHRTGREQEPVWDNIHEAIRMFGLHIVDFSPGKMTMDPEAFAYYALSCRLLIGNSSCGVIESATYGIPTVNVGDRQAGRVICGANVISCGDTLSEIVTATKTAMSLPVRAAWASAYQHGVSAVRNIWNHVACCLNKRLQPKTVRY